MRCCCPRSARRLIRTSTSCLLLLPLLSLPSGGCSDAPSGGPSTSLDASAPDGGGTSGAGDASSDIGARSKFDYGYAPGTGLVSLVYPIGGEGGRATVTVTASFVKTRGADPVRRLVRGDCLTLSADLEAGKVPVGVVGYALPGAVTVSGGSPVFSKTFTPSSSSVSEGASNPSLSFLGGGGRAFCEHGWRGASLRPSSSSPSRPAVDRSRQAADWRHPRTA